MNIGIEIKFYDKTTNKEITTFEDTFNIILSKFIADKGWIVYNSERGVNNYYTDEDGYNETEVAIATILKLFGYDRSRIKKFLKDEDDIEEESLIITKIKNMIKESKIDQQSDIVDKETNNVTIEED